ncbi:MAG: hypothetical protein AMJ75_06080 [Phycisphaerae bacterium SM1_79]|nr:MAG: hypothetical protein AMJ75_06080 [Phycisphaerae bacterium SM1_79]
MAKKKKTRRITKTKKINQNFLKRYCNLVPDPFDPRDFQYGAGIVGLRAPAIPKRVDYSNETEPVGDQRYTGSCVGWASAYGLRNWLRYQETGQKQPKFSVRFAWMGAKEHDPFELNVAFDLSGTRIRDAFKIMRKFGACPDKLWPFSKLLPNPDYEDRIRREAMRHRIGIYYSLVTNQERRIHLAKEGPFVVGVPVYSNWATIDASGVVPGPGGAFRGGHALLVVGYDDKTQLFKFQNSWGSNWGDKGYGYLTYEYMKNHSWSSWGAERLR